MSGQLIMQDAPVNEPGLGKDRAKVEVEIKVTTITRVEEKSMRRRR
jgi:hypothetical protein